MEGIPAAEFSISEDILQQFFGESNSCNLKNSLEILTESAKSAVGRSELTLKGILPAVLKLSQALPSHSELLLSSLKLLRNLCAGEIANQNMFVELNGVAFLSRFLRSLAVSSDPDPGLIRMGLQVLANVSLAGKKHQHAIWQELFSDGFLALARVCSRETCDPLCLIIYTCCDENPELFGKLIDCGLPIAAEIVRTVSAVGFGEHRFNLLLSKFCLENSKFSQLFTQLQFMGVSENEGADFGDDQFSKEQAFLLQIISEILNEGVTEITVMKDVTLFTFEIFKKSIKVLDHASKGLSGLPTGSSAVDVLGYSLSLLRDICAQDSTGGSTGDQKDSVEMLLSLGLIELLLSLLVELEPPSTIRKAIKQGENREGASSSSSKRCPYKGFRRDIVSVIGNCAYRRKQVQDKIRQKNGILLLLQQCVIDYDNPFLREWGIWSVRNILEGNEENQRVVAELELQGSVDVPEIASLGLRVEVDQKTQRAKLVNVPRRTFGDSP
ncbi:Ataxin-10 [Quillaja saponaria]|uniref:Ataxin-10 n=1 Tax=Quillaja saponaria TaxID=32244 RepID=A0AAD7L3S6_QUISA|nr:Ataxin-10 [Quillaja saponaria]